MTRPAAPTSTGPRPVRAALLIAQPIQHFVPGLRLLAASPDLACRVYYWQAPTGASYDHGFGRRIRWNIDLFSGYDWWAPPAEQPAWQRSVDTVRQLRRHQPEVILSFGWASPAARLGIAYATASRTPLLYYGDSNWASSASAARRRWKRRVLGGLFRRAAGAVSTGTFNREFYIAHRMDPALIHPGVYPCDVEQFRAAARRRQRPVPLARDADLVIAFAGKFLPAKAPADLIEAASRLPADRRWRLWLIGDGPLRPELERLVAERGIADRVRFLGFQNCDELPALMSEVDIIVMPSRKEPRGLVPIEGMAAGAVAVVSSATGVWGPGDVVQHGETGLVYPAGDRAALTGCLRRLIDEPALRQRLAVAGRARAMRSGPGDFAALAARAMLAAARRSGYVPAG